MDFTSLPPGALGNYDEGFTVYRGTSSAGARAVVIVFVDPETKEEHYVGLTSVAARRLAHDIEREADAIDATTWVLAVPTYRLHAHDGDDLGLLEHPAPNVEPGDVVLLADGREALVTTRIEGGQGSRFEAILQVIAGEPCATSRTTPAP
jgi:hypothetical protein